MSANNPNLVTYNFWNTKCTVNPQNYNRPENIKAQHISSQWEIAAITTALTAMAGFGAKLASNAVNSASNSDHTGVLTNGIPAIWLFFLASTPFTMDAETSESLIQMIDSVHLTGESMLCKAIDVADSIFFREF